MNNITDKGFRNCTGCQMCSVVCPSEAIKIKLDEDGFYVPIVNNNECVSCGLCKETCYKYDNNIKMLNEDARFIVYAAQSKDKEILRTSSSGGVATHIARYCLKQGYKVAGVTYDTKGDIALHAIATTEEDLELFKGSKYMQSYTEKVFKDIIRDESRQRYAIFGTPCQIYALKRYSEKVGQTDDNRFLLVDIFCHGCPSMLLWKKYKRYIKDKLNVGEFDKVEFRNKSYGWHEYCHVFSKGDIYYKSKKVNDPFFTIFFDDAVLAKSCYDCKIRSTLAYTDIRLGDFWGFRYALNKEGVSAVVVCSNKGETLFSEIKNEIKFKKHKLAEVIKYQSVGLAYSLNEETRNKTIKLLKTDSHIRDMVKEYTKHYTLKKRVKLYIKRVFYILPKSLRDIIKKVCLFIRSYAITMD